MADHLHASHLGRRDLPNLYDRHLHLEESVCDVLTSCTPAYRHGALVLVHLQAVPTAEQVRELELGVRGPER